MSFRLRCHLKTADARLIHDNMRVSWTGFEKSSDLCRSHHYYKTKSDWEKELDVGQFGLQSEHTLK